MFKRLHIALNQREANVDYFRGIAILMVILFHFDHILSFGFLGVDVFFVISGYLVSRALLNEVRENKKTEWKTFFIKRLTKIIPSYYFFLIVGLIFARLFLLENYSEQVISFNSLPSYLFFYMNYDLSFNWSFEMAWSLCVEEHFYLFLVLIFIILTYTGIVKNRLNLLGSTIIFFIILSNIFKVLGHFNGWEVEMASHMRMDALFIGVYLAYQEINLERIFRLNWVLFILGILFFTGIVLIYLFHNSLFFENVLLHSLTPISVYLMLRGSKNLDLKPLFFLRAIAYYSYNWYLWHSLIAFSVLNLLSLNFTFAFLLYFLSSFIIAMLVTHLIEEPFLKIRKRILKS